MADPHRAGRGGGGAGARLGGARPRPRGRRAAARRAGAGRGRRRRPPHRRARRARPQRPARRWAGARSRRPARPARASCSTCTTTGSSAPWRMCFTHGEDCTRCRGRNTLPGVRLNCRGGSRAESAAYAAGLALWQRRIAGAADAFVVPSAFALARLHDARRAARRPRAGDPLRAAHVRRALPSGRRAATRSTRGGWRRRRASRTRSRPAARPAVPLVVAGDGPQAAELRRPRPGADVRFTGRVDAAALADAARAAPRSRSCRRATRRSSRSPRWRRWPRGSRSSPPRAGGLAELVPEAGLHPPGDVRRARRRASRPCGATRPRAKRPSPRCARARARRWWRGALRAVYDGA